MKCSNTKEYLSLYILYDTGTTFRERPPQFFALRGQSHQIRFAKKGTRVGNFGAEIRYQKKICPKIVWLNRPKWGVKCRTQEKLLQFF
jgi:hypothetical protein